VPEGYPKLDFKPFQLETWFLMVTATFFVCCGAGIVVVMHLAGDPERLNLRQTSSQLSYQYIPGLIGIVTTIWFGSVVSTYGHIRPYIEMAAVSMNYHRTLSTVGSYASFQATGFQLMSLLKHHEWLIFVFAYTPMLLNIFFLPLKTSFIIVVMNEDGTGTLAVSQHVGVALVVAYSLFLSYTLTILAKVYNKRTSLRWDPTTIADVLSLLHGSGLTRVFQGHEFLYTRDMLVALKKQRHITGPLRLGYWCSNCDNVVRHGIGFITPVVSGIAAESCLRGVC
jgi:FtsH-binding integral membrane protein